MTLYAESSAVLASLLEQEHGQPMLKASIGAPTYFLPPNGTTTSTGSVDERSAGLAFDSHVTPGIAGGAHIFMTPSTQSR